MKIDLARRMLAPNLKIINKNLLTYSLCIVFSHS